jgi:hypothetical protein
MGYRSDLVLCIRTEKVAELKTRYAVGECPDAKQLFEPYPEGFFETVEEGDDFYTWRTYSTKFYDSYTDVRALLNLFELMEEEEEEGEPPYAMIRLGEEETDIEYYGAPYEFEMYVSRDIQIGY